MSWRPQSDVRVARTRARMQTEIRRFFAERGVLEVSTPLLTAYAPTDPAIASLAVHRRDRDWFLHSSPEYHMKRLLAAGFPDMYQLCPVFRDEERGSSHLPEFTMLEWYRREFSLQRMMQETIDLFFALLTRFEPAPPAFSTYADAFRATLGIDPLSASCADLAEAVAADAMLRESLGEDRDAWLDLAMAEHVSSIFPADRPTVIYHYPASQAALARLAEPDRRVAERFEVFVGKLEIANGYVELTDAAEQRGRFVADGVRRRARNLPVPPADPDLLAAMDSGLPPCAGVALGFERLLMIETGARRIDDVVTFVPGGNTT